MAVADQFDTVQKIYIAFYQRPADPAGLKFWAENVDAAGGDLSTVINAFATSAEATDLYGEINEETIGDVIDQIYQGLFGRDADEAGKAYYAAEFAAGNITAGNIALAVLSGAQNDDEAAIANKLAVANEFTLQVDGRELTDAAFGTAPFNVTYSGNEDAEAARGILAGVTADAETVLTPAEVTAALRSQIADEGDPIGEGALVDQLAAYQAAVEAQNEAQVTLSAALVEAGIGDVEYDEETETYTGFDADNVEAYVEAAEAAVQTATADLATERANASDASVQKAVVDAQTAVNQDTGRYTEDGVPLFAYYQAEDETYTTESEDAVFVGYTLDASFTTGAEAPEAYEDTAYTARNLQSRAVAAEAALDADVSGRGTTLELASSLSDAIGAFLARNADLAGGELQAVVDAYLAVVAAIESGTTDIEDSVEYGAWEDAVDAAIEAGFNVELDTDEGRGAVDAEDSVIEGGARGDAVESALLSLNSRFNLEETLEVREEAFEGTEVGSGLVVAQEALEVREGFIAALATAEENAEAISEAAAAYAEAGAQVEAAAEALGLEIEELDAGIEFATDDADLFIFDAEALKDAEITDVVINDLAADDIIYLGNAYTLGNADSADNNALEVFLTEVNGNAVLQIENTAFGSASDSFTEITLTGIAQADVTIEDGVVTFA